MQLYFILLSSATDVRTSADRSIPNGSLKKSYTLLLPIINTVFSLMDESCLSDGLKIILKLVKIKFP